ncbi:MAG: T9SS C-terminal target domain-containing protein [Saprospirales bacterium]|nr:MAG: T9SS C-terminal target domain-containing protein [Saprospirales bacterium]
MKKLIHLGSIAVFYLLALGIGAQNIHEVTVESNSFNPQHLEIYTGDTVSWFNTGGLHNVNGSTDEFPDNPESFFSGDPESGNWEYLFIFNTPGYYDYQCDIHAGGGMTGTITVSDPSAYMEVSMQDIRENNADGVPVLIDELVTVTAVVYGGNLRTQGLQFTMIDSTNTGVVIFSPSDDFGYEVNEGDMIQLWGEVSFFNGLTQINPDSIELISGDNLLVDPTVVTELGEDTESSLIMIESVYITNPEDWPSPGDNANIYVSNQQDTFLMRIQREVDLGNDPPADTFDLVGIGGQFTTNIPADDGYQIIPRYADDLGIELDDGPDYLPVTIPEVRENDSDFFPVLMGERVEVSGVVYGGNLRPQGLQFTIIDDDNVGVSVFNASADLDYSVTEGDLITIWGEVDQFNGLAQVVPDSIELISQDNPLVDPRVVTELGEDTESSLILIESVYITNPEDWPSPGDNANIFVSNLQDTFLMRIQREVDLGDEAPTDTFDLVGIGGQFTNNIPADDGYQIIPRYADDLGILLDEDLDYLPVTIPEVRENDTDFFPVLMGERVEVTGIVYGGNLRPQGLQFTIIDDDNVGVSVFNASGDLDYSVTEGDMITIWGEVDQFNGLAQIAPDSIELISQDNPLVDPRVVTEFGEDTESSLIMLEDVEITNPEDWPSPGSAANIFVENQHGTFLMRIQREVNLGANPPVGVFDLIGIGSQFTTNVPADDGYQIIPRYADDVGADPSDQYMPVTMPELRENDLDGIPVLIGELVEATAVVYGINYRPQGLQFTIIDENNVGVGIFRPSGNLDYEVTEGDLITVRGEVSEFRGLTQINAHEIDLIDTNQELVEPMVVDELDESTESSLVQLQNVVIQDPTEWPQEGEEGNVVLERNGETFILRVQRESRLGAALEDVGLNVTGIGTQFTTNIPANDGYQIVPRYEEDIEPVVSVYNIQEEVFIDLWPNPVQDRLNITSDYPVESISIFSTDGRLIEEFKTDSGSIQLDISGYQSGTYIVKVETVRGAAISMILVSR